MLVFVCREDRKTQVRRLLKNTVQNRISFQRLSSKKVGFSMIEIKNLSKSFQTADGTVEALKNVTITVPDGDIYGIIGMSGAGKSTLVRCINMLERPSEGTVVIDGRDIGALSDAELRSVRRNITMIFQGFNLLMQRTCLKNICFPLGACRN